MLRLLSYAGIWHTAFALGTEVTLEVPANALEIIKETILKELRASIKERGGSGRRPWKIAVHGKWPEWYQGMGDDFLFQEAEKQLVNEGKLVIQHHAWIGWYYLCPPEHVNTNEVLPDGVSWITKIP